ncbi:MAG TPA: hypothetical protein PLO51_05625, partial [Candidatus Micrarchaeota archaeon]|nr:hypothetical protein [Candidatus Micrarchaeota archaeon]
VLVNGTEFAANLTNSTPPSFYFRETSSYLGFSTGGDFWYKNGAVAYQPSDQPPGDTIIFLKKAGRFYVYSEVSKSGTVRGLDAFSNAFAKSAAFDELSKLFAQASFQASYSPAINSPQFFPMQSGNASNAPAAQTESAPVNATGTPEAPPVQNSTQPGNESISGQNASGQNASGQAAPSGGSSAEGTTEVPSPYGPPGAGNGTSSPPQSITVSAFDPNMFPHGYFYASNTTSSYGGADCRWYYFIKSSGKMTSFCLALDYPVPLYMEIEDALGTRSIIISGYSPATLSESVFSIPSGVNITPYITPAPQEYLNQSVAPSIYTNTFAFAG